MAIRIAVAGLRQAGISVAMALANIDRDIQLFGWDPEKELLSAARDKKIFRSVKKDLDDIYEDSQIIILSLQPVELEKFAEEIGNLITEDKFVINITKTHNFSARILQNHLTNTSHYLSLLPALNPEIIFSSDFHWDVPSEKLFKEGLIYIIDPLNADPRMMELTVDLCVLMGGRPILADAIEVDGLISANLLLPLLSASVIVATVANQPGWREGRNIAGDVLYRSAAPLQNALQTEAFSQNLFIHREQLVRLINDFIQQLIFFRDLLANSDRKALDEKIQTTVDQFNGFVMERSAPLPPQPLATSIPDATQALKRVSQITGS